MIRTWVLLSGLMASLCVRANHPLLTDDTEVIDKGSWQLELHGARARDRQSGFTVRSTEAAVALSYGVAKDFEFQVELPYLRVTADDGTTRAHVRGRGDLQMELKWNFYERDGLGFLLKPRLSLPTGSDHVSADRAQYGVDFVAAKEFGVFELLGQVGYVRNRNREGDRESLWHVSAALLWSATERLKLLVDFGRDSNPDPAGEGAIREWVYGFQYDISSAIDFGLGVKNSLGEAADDRALLAGLRLRW